jgi:hypothetical protein
MASGLHVMDVMESSILDLKLWRKLNGIDTRPQLKSLSSDELTSYPHKIFSTVWATSEFNMSDNLCHKTSSQMKVRVLMCSHALNQALYWLLVLADRQIINHLDPLPESRM